MNDAIGQHWLLLRGLARESAHWGEFVPLLQSAFPTAQITLLDLPGTGIYHQQNSPCTIPAIMAHVRNTALQEGLLARPATLLAISLGAMVGWEWLQRYPAEINGAVLMNTSFANLSAFYQRLRWQSLGRFLSLLLQNDPYKRERAILELVSNNRQAYGKTAGAWAAIQTARPISAGNALRQIIAAATFRPNGNGPRQPVMLLNGMSDRLVSPLCSEAIHTKWQLPIYRHPWAGHDLTLDDGEWVLQRLLAWQAEINGQA